MKIEIIEINNLVSGHTSYCVAIDEKMEHCFTTKEAANEAVERVLIAGVMQTRVVVETYEVA